MITVYMSDNCLHCQKLKGWLNEEQVVYQEKNVKNIKFSDELDAMGVAAIPYTIVDNGEEQYNSLGFNDKTKEIINNYLKK